MMDTASDQKIIKNLIEKIDETLKGRGDLEAQLLEQLVLRSPNFKLRSPKKRSLDKKSIFKEKLQKSTVKQLRDLVRKHGVSCDNAPRARKAILIGAIEKHVDDLVTKEARV